MATNEKRIIQEHTEEKFYVPVGYPLGYGVTKGEPHKDKENIRIYYPKDYIVERYSEKVLTRIRLELHDEFFLWTRILFLHDEETRKKCDMTLLTSLKEKKVMIEADTPLELFENMLPLRAVRQGFGLAEDNKECIRLGHDVIYIEGLQLFIWREANGNSISDIFTSAVKSYDVSIKKLENDFPPAIMQLIKSGILILQ